MTKRMTQDANGVSTATFDSVVPRAGSGAVKYDARKAVFGTDQVIPLWVADMDFATPAAITRALAQRAEHPVYGYSMFPESLYQAMMDWFRERHQWSIERESIVLVPGVVPSLHAACLAFAGPGEGVIIQPPVYPPFYSAIEQTGRRVLENPLQLQDGCYQLDLAHLEQCAADARLLLLCSPHNPVGRVWQPEELDAILAIARRHQLVVLADEIHADLVFPDSHRHTPLALRAGAEDALVTAVAPSKSFNIPGLGLSALVVPDRDRRQALARELDRLHVRHCNPFSATAFEAGYRHGGPWLDALLGYLQGNRDRVCERLAAVPGITAHCPQGTYLSWLDCRDLGLDDAGLKRFFIHQAGLGLNPGRSFGAAGSGFMRLNLGTSRAQLDQALDQLAAALAS